jgi:hypothetical protein
MTNKSIEEKKGKTFENSITDNISNYKSQFFAQSIFKY